MTDTEIIKTLTEAIDLMKWQQAEIEFYRERANKYEAEVAVLLEQTRKQKHLRLSRGVSRRAGHKQPHRLSVV